MVVLALYGDGKGKTSSSIGQCVRALGHDSNSVLIIQFNKNDKSIGEFKFFFNKHPMINCRLVQYGVGCTHYKLKAQKRCMECGECSKNERLNRTKVEWAIQHIKRDKNKYGVILLDEVLVSLSLGYISIEEIMDLMGEPNGKTWILTGRVWGEKADEILAWLGDFADYITHVEMIKHPFNKGVVARKGVEY